MLGIVVLNYRTWELTLRCMKSIEETKGKLDVRIYLVDNASPVAMPNEVSQYISEHTKEIVFLQSKNNGGYAAGNNIGIRQAQEDNCSHIVITNNDIVFCENSLQNLLKSFEIHPEIGIVGPKVLGEDGKIQSSCCSVKTGMKEMFQIYTVAKLFCKKKWNTYFCLDRDLEKPMYPYHVLGCCFAMSAKCAKDIAPLDEGTMLYFEEPIIGIKMEQKGYKTYYTPDSTVIHKHGATTAGVQPFMYQCICESELYYSSKYLHAKKWQLWMQYNYRKILYWLRSRKDERLKAYWREYKKNTALAYEKAKKR